MILNFNLRILFSQNYDAKIKKRDLDFKLQFKNNFFSKLWHEIKKCDLDFKLHLKNKFDLKTKAQIEEKILIIRISMIVS